MMAFEILSSGAAKKVLRQVEVGARVWKGPLPVPKRRRLKYSADAQLLASAEKTHSCHKKGARAGIIPAPGARSLSLQHRLTLYFLNAK